MFRAAAKNLLGRYSGYSALYLPRNLFTKSRVVAKQPLCWDCKYFIANNLQCSSFGRIDSVTGLTYFESAYSVRSNDEKCGQDAKEFEINRFKVITVPYYFLAEWWMLISLAVFPLALLSKVFMIVLSY